MDVLHFPAAASPRETRAPPARSARAVLYCNPNAGLIEVAAGMGLIGGNLPSSDGGDQGGENGAGASCWTDFYTRRGWDVYVFNYAGYGRSYGTTLCASGAKPGDHDYRPGLLPRLGRIVRSTFLTFTPRPDTLRSDGIAVALHLLNHLGVENLVIHGESIGGVAASAAGRYLSSLPSARDKVSLLVCDRTFCNLEAVAQRLVGGWSGYAIRALAPLWGTDVAGDFVASTVPKVVATDAADAIIDDAASLKSGIALWKEIRRGAARSTRDVAWMSDPPLQYRMADWENVCVTDSRYVAGAGLLRPQAPAWPADRRITLDAAFHFAACCTRIGKLAKGSRTIIATDFEAAIEYDDRTGAVPSTNVLFEAWKAVACCDGLTGAPLGVAVKRGFDATVAWLCSSVVYGGQVVATRARARCGALSNGPLNATDQDFDRRPPDYEADEGGEKIHPKPLPQVVQSLNYFLEAGDESLRPRTLPLGLLQHGMPAIALCPHCSFASNSFHLQFRTSCSSLLAC
jgi:pimeloyl-ACP methyl ester carboxylesterase